MVTPESAVKSAQRTAKGLVVHVTTPAAMIAGCSRLRRSNPSCAIGLARTLPGLDAQLRFAPVPPRDGWTPGHLPPDARIAAALLLLYPGEHGISLPLTLRASGLRRHAGQISLPGGATDPGETLARGGAS